MNLKGSNHARLPSTMEVDSSKTRQFGDILKKWMVTAPKRRKSARRPQKLEVDNIKNEACLQDSLQK